ncbi:MAG: MetS family NSS transporter small subunit [Firmicutes bacterium]|nr:MetS family NSS transporter small subunit [Bacillota bacterium]
MSISAIIMMCIACVGLWGGAAVFLGIILKSKSDD